MKSKIIYSIIVVLTGLFLYAPMCWAKDKAYNYIVAYSYKTKIVYHTSVFPVKVDGVSYNDEEFVADTEMILGLESAFQEFITDELRLNSMDYTVSARAGYKTDEIAKRKLEREISDFRFKGFKVEEVNKFKFK